MAVDICAGAEWLTIAEVARHYRVSARTISRWAASGEIRSKRIGPSGRCVRIHRSVIEAEPTLSVSAA